MRAIETNIPTDELEEMNAYLEKCKPNDRPTIQTSAPGRQSVFRAGIYGSILRFAVHPQSQAQKFKNTRWVKVSPEMWRRVYQEIKEKTAHG